MGIQGWLHPDPTPEPVLPSCPAQFVASTLMILAGVVIERIAARSLIRYRREVSRIRDQRPDE